MLLAIKNTIDIAKSMFITLLAKLYISSCPFSARTLLSIGKNAVDIERPTNVNIVSGIETAIL